MILCLICAVLHLQVPGTEPGLIGVVPLKAPAPLRPRLDNKQASVGAPSSNPPKPFQSRFQLEAPCPYIPAVMIDRYGSGVGLASETARAKRLQARMMWIDATANIDQYNSTTKIHKLIATIADSGFNTVVFDIKPISGQTVYPSKLAPKLKEWRGQSLPEEFDPIPDFVQECHRAKLSLIVSMNAFSEGHRLFKVGPGYEEQDEQTVLYIPQPVLKTATARLPLVGTIDQLAPEKISVLSSRAKIPKGEGFSLLFGPDGSVISGSDRPDWNNAGSGTLLFGAGEIGKRLKEQVSIRSTLRFDTEAKFVPIGEQTGGQIPLMMNINDPRVQDHALSMIQEVLQKYEVDGIIYDDRLRYSGMDGDFSPLTRSKFEERVGKKLNWPDDIFKYTLSESLSKGIQPGPYYDLWLSWRTQQIKEYVQRVRRTVKSTRPTAQFGAYVGSWYGDYPALGHNYASPDASAGFWFTTPEYQAQGTAPDLDYLVVGCYYPTATIYDAMKKGSGLGYTVEAAGALCNRLARDETWTYAGIDCGMFVTNPRGLNDAIQAACFSTQGVMVFDLSHGTDKLWSVFKQAFRSAAIAPHQVSGSITDLRKRRAMVDAFHQAERPIIILNGSAGVGQ